MIRPNRIVAYLGDVLRLHHVARDANRVARDAIRVARERGNLLLSGTV